MYRIIDEKSTGKTSKLMAIAKENDAIFVCGNPRAMEYKAKQYGIEGIEFVSYGEFFTYRANGKNYVIDEVESFIMQSLGSKFIGYTLSKND